MCCEMQIFSLFTNSSNYLQFSNPQSVLLLLGGAAFLLKSLQLLLKLKHKRESENVLQFSCTENFSWNILRILTWTAAFCKKNEQKNGYMKKKKKKKNRQPSRHVEHRCSNSDPNEKKNVIKINLKMENF